MNAPLKASILAGLLCFSGAGAVGYHDYSVANIAGWQQVRFWCDTPAHVLAVTAPAHAPGPVTLATWRGTQQLNRAYRMGVDDPGAGQVYTPLSLPGQPAPPDPGYFVHSSNIENVNDPAYRMTHVNEFNVSSGHFTCRYVPQAAVLAATAKHTVIVWEAGGHVTYASRNRNGTPGVYLTGGVHTHTPAGRDRYVWTHAAYTYELEVGVPDTTAPLGGHLRVLRGGAVLSTWPLQVYSVSVPN